MPAFNCVGRREHWLAFDPRALRSWAMTPLALTLGLMPLEASERSRVPERRHISEVDAVNGQLRAGHGYVGSGHHCTRVKRTKWSPPFTPATIAGRMNSFRGTCTSYHSRRVRRMSLRGWSSRGSHLIPTSGSPCLGGEEVTHQRGGPSEPVSFRRPSA